MPAAGVALGVGLLCAIGVGLLWCSLHPPRLRRETSPGTDAQMSVRLGLIAAVVGVAVMFVTGSVVMTLAAVLLVIGWPLLFASRAAAQERRKLAAVQKWLGDLRDTVWRSSVGIEPALELVAEQTTGVLAEPMHQFVLRRRQGVPIPEALQEVADTIRHPTADTAVAAITLVVSGGAGGGELAGTLDELARASRDELATRVAIDRIRRTYERTMKRLVWLTVGFVAMLIVMAPEMIDAYRTPAGQVWLLVPLAVWAGCLVWLRSLARYGDEPRNRLRLEELT